MAPFSLPAGSFNQQGYQSRLPGVTKMGQVKKKCVEDRGEITQVVDTLLLNMLA